MTKGIKGLWLALVLFLVTTSAMAAGSVTGLWKTIDDVTGKPKAIVNITESGGVLAGTIVKIFPRPGYDQNELCEHCQGANHNKRIVGMTIMYGLTKEKNNPGNWSGGRILDPMNGKTYRCAVQLSGSGQVLNVRGYIGIKLLGRTQEWHRVSSAN